MLFFKEKKLNLNKGNFFPFFISFLLLYFLFIFPIIRSNVFYIDDNQRAIFSYNGLMGDGRLFADFFLRFLFFFNHHVVDVAPLFQLLSIVILAFSSALLAIAWRCNLLTGLLSVSFIVCSPFVIQSLSYRFDSITMSLAITCAMSVLGIRPYLTKIGYFFCATFLVFSIYNIYQSTSNLFVILACTSSILLLKDCGCKKATSELFLNVLIFLASSILYTIELPFIKKNWYTNNHSNFTLDYHIIIHNILHFYHTASLGFWGERLLGKSMGLMCLIGLISFCLKVVLSTRRTGVTLDNIKYYGICGSLILCEFVFIPGVFVFLQSPIYDFRFFTSIGGIYASCALFILGRKNTFNSFNKALVLLVSISLYGNFLLVYAYGNAEIAQQELDTHISETLTEDLYHLVGNKPATLFINDFPLAPIAPTAPRAQIILNKYPLLYHILQKPLGEYDATGLIKALGMPDNVTIRTGILTDLFNKVDLCHNTEFHKKISHKYYDLYYKDSEIFLDYLHRCSP